MSESWSVADYDSKMANCCSISADENRDFRRAANSSKLGENFIFDYCLKEIRSMPKID